MDMKKLLLLITTICFVTMLQAQVSKTVQVDTAGGLAPALTAIEKSTITNITITGNIDARDFVTMHDMNVLSTIDISETKIAAFTYNKASTIPHGAFSHDLNLTSIILPSSVTSIQWDAFGFCENLTTIDIPSTVMSIDIDAFLGCPGLINIDANNPTYSSIDGVLFNKNQDEILRCPTSKTGNYVIPATVKSIGFGVFFNDSNLTSITILSYINYIYLPFRGCKGIRSIIIYSITPPFLSPLDDQGIFDDINKTNCILYVPFGTRSAYQTSSHWNEFINIVEMGSWNLDSSICLSSKDKSSININNLTKGNWTARTSASWLTLSNKSGLSGDSLVITATANTATTPRSTYLAIITNGIIDSIKVTQLAGDTVLTLSKATISFTDTLSTKKVFVSANAPWSATANVSWLTISPATGMGSDSLVITAMANTTTTPRSTYITVKTNGISDSIKVTQNAIDTLSLSKAILSFTDTLNSKKVFISTNAPWSASADVSWLTISPASGTASDSITITAQANTTNVARTGTITITSQTSVTLKAAVQQTITVTQAANSGTPIVEITNERITLYPNPANSSFSVNTNANIEIYNLSSQLILTTKAVNNEPISLKDVPSGVYFVKIITASGVVTKSLVIQ
jgi:hypothetical protein